MTRIRLVSLVATVSVLLTACGGGPDTSQQSDGPSTPATTGESGDVHVASSEHGDILVGPDGSSLYVFTADSDGSSACTEACAETWPPVKADIGILSDLDQSMFSSITREDGTDQLTVNGMPLYFYAVDSGPGDTSGQGLNDAWFVVSPSGTKIESSAPGTDDSIVDYEY